MVLGLYYSTKLRNNAKGEGMTFYSPEEVIIAYNEKVIDMHARIKLRLHNTTVRSLKDENNPSRGSVIYKTDAAKGNHIIETSVGRVLFNQVVPKEVGFINELLTKRTLRDIINLILKTTGVAQTVKFPGQHQRHRVRHGLQRRFVLQPGRRDCSGSQSPID